MEKTISAETIAKVKEQHPDMELYRGGVSFNDDNGERRELEFIYRRPSVADMEAFNKAVLKSSVTAQSNLLASLIVYPAPADIVNGLAAYPPVVADFINERVAPFFGTAIVSRSSRI